MENEYKQVIVVRNDLRLSKGKLAVQVAHASATCIIKIIKAKDKTWEEWLWSWIEEGQKKVVVKVKDLDELKNVLVEAERLGLPTSFIIDAGKTEIPSGTPTCVGIGPAPANIIDKITGKLPIL